MSLSPKSQSLPTPVSRDADDCHHLDPLWLVSCLEPRRLQLQNIPSAFVCPTPTTSVCHHGPSASLELGWESSILRDKPQHCISPVGLPMTGASEGTRSRRATVVTRLLPGVEGTEHDCRRWEDRGSRDIDMACPKEEAGGPERRIWPVRAKAVNEGRWQQSEAHRWAHRCELATSVLHDRILQSSCR